MKRRSPAVPASSVLAAARRFAASRRAVAGIEFAVLAPVLLVMFAGTIDLGYALTANRKTAQIAATVADLVSDDNEWSVEDVSDLLTASSFILRPYDLKNLSIVLTIESVAEDGTVEVATSQAFQGTPSQVGEDSPVPVPAGLKTPGVQLILAQATYKISTPFASLWSAATGTSVYTFDRHFFARPRRSDTIDIK